ncbi:hypothetical protein P885DRAFT_80832 [Corynascus similis CBS 632.67]
MFDDGQWQGMIDLHRCLVDLHRKFMQHPSASLELAEANDLPGRMWRHGVYGFFEFLKHHHPASAYHMRRFIDVALTTMRSLYNSSKQEIPALYRRVAHSEVAGKAPTTGALYYFLAASTRHVGYEKFFYLWKSLCVTHRYYVAREELVAVSQGALAEKTIWDCSFEPLHQAIEPSFVQCQAILFSGDDRHRLRWAIMEFLTTLKYREYQDYESRVWNRLVSSQLAL